MPLPMGTAVRPPEFWIKDGALGRVLDPFGRMYGAAAAWRIKHGAYVRAPVPVISVGNLTVGGTGKTPVARDLVPRLTELGYRPAVILRGYGGTMKGPIRVDPDKHRAIDVGDEALLHSRDGMTWVARKRIEGAYQATETGAKAIILDDAHQHGSMAKDLSLVVVDGVTGFGNHRVVPAGPLRERISGGLVRADAVVIMGDDQTGLTSRLPPDLPVLRATLEPSPESAHLNQRKVVAFAGLGRPGKFFNTLVELGAQVVAAHPFDDHHLYRPADIQTILDEAFALEALPVTTEKDAMRLTPDQRQQVNVLRVGVQWKDAALLQALLERTLGAGRGTD